METIHALPILDSYGWVAAAEDTEAGEPLPNPFNGFLPPLTKGRATILGGPPGGGKTALALQYFRHITEMGYKTIFVSLEMTPNDLFERFSRQFDSEEDCKQWIIDGDAKVTESYISAPEIELIMKGGYDFVVIDHLHELQYEDRMQLEREVKRLLAMAPAHNVALLALAQLRRPDPAFPREPSMHDFKESGVFEQKGAVLLSIYREDEHSDYAQIWTVKNRFGSKHAPFDVKLDKSQVIFKKA
jgi:replicative DNA helicase